MVKKIKFKEVQATNFDGSKSPMTIGYIDVSDIVSKYLDGVARAYSEQFRHYGKLAEARKEYKDWEEVDIPPKKTWFDFDHLYIKFASGKTMCIDAPESAMLGNNTMGIFD